MRLRPGVGENADPDARGCSHDFVVPFDRVAARDGHLTTLPIRRDERSCTSSRCASAAAADRLAPALDVAAWVACQRGAMHRNQGQVL